MSWASRRKTSRVEDIAYCLLESGDFGREKQGDIPRSPYTITHRGQGDIPRSPYTITHRGLSITLNVRKLGPHTWAAPIKCWKRKKDNSRQICITLVEMTTAVITRFEPHVHQFVEVSNIQQYIEDKTFYVSLEDPQLDGLPIKAVRNIPALAKINFLGFTKERTQCAFWHSSQKTGPFSAKTTPSLALKPPRSILRYLEVTLQVQDGSTLAGWSVYQSRPSIWPEVRKVRSQDLKQFGTAAQISHGFDDENTLLPNEPLLYPVQSGCLMRFDLRQEYQNECRVLILDVTSTDLYPEGVLEGNVLHNQTQQYKDSLYYHRQLEKKQLEGSARSEFGFSRPTIVANAGE
ncbi:uncharacterized protein KY384_003409 [Bacidia gigantensis]|uniref:uncharacterized protein n=1 Tax=Bacidia gigantensis TaxID=2732470 RepID=UPI001D05B419|nr:uncharacterized protein KY384_003409 [Bacidia gigantensis]KAG8531773.1 hypothetical protein KY384_003409 [Bacidia gigantensis]